MRIEFADLLHAAFKPFQSDSQKQVGNCPPGGQQQRESLCLPTSEAGSACRYAGRPIRSVMEDLRESYRKALTSS